MTKINKSENTNFNKQFAHILFHSYLSDTFDLIGFGAEGIVAGSKINSELWLSNYLVKKELNDQFHFEEMLEEIQVRLRKPFRFHQQTTDNYDVRDFIEVGPAIRERVVHVNRKILHDEGILNYDESIVGKLEQKASLEPLEVVKEILKESKVPLVYQLLLTKLNIRCPDHHLNQYELEAMLDNCPEIYYGGHYIGYGIKKWSKATEILKKGRISDAAIEILRHETEPITIKSLLYKLKSYRVIVNVAAALAALKSEQNKNIAFYEDDYVGLCIDAVKSAEDDEDDDGEVPVLPFGVWDV